MNAVVLLTGWCFGVAWAVLFRSEEWGQRMVLVALTGYGQAADVRAAKAAGFNHYLLNPVLHQVLEKVFAGVPSNDDKLAV